MDYMVATMARKKKVVEEVLDDQIMDVIGEAIGAEPVEVQDEDVQTAEVTVYADGEVETHEHDETQSDVTEEGNDPDYGAAASQAAQAEIDASYAQEAEAEEVPAEVPAEEDAAPTTGHNNPDALKDKLLKRCSGYGKAAKQGDAALPSMALDVFQQASELNIGTQDADPLYSHYLAGRQGLKARDVTSPTQQVSKLRGIIRAGYYTGSDGVDMFNYANDKFVEAREDPEIKKQMKTTAHYDWLVSVAVQQNARIPDNTPLGADVPVLTEDEIDALLFPDKDKEEKGPADKLAAIIKNAEALRKGRKGSEARPEIPPVNEPELDDAIEQLKQLMWKLDPDEAEKMAAAEKARQAKQMVAEGLVAQLGISSQEAMRLINRAK
jgi:hypothetical protein